MLNKMEKLNISKLADKTKIAYYSASYIVNRIPYHTMSSSTNGIGQSDTSTSGTTHWGSMFMSIAMIGISEIGDKTFLIAALMAMRHPRLLVFSAAATSLGIMTILSGVLGHTFVHLMPESLTNFLAGMLFLVFGYKLTLEGLEMSKDAGVEEELVEVEQELAISDINHSGLSAENGGEKVARKSYLPGKSLQKVNGLLQRLISPVWIQTFMMVFLGELGDRSQISIIALATDSDYWYVISGAVLGHCICTGMAVMGGKLLATKISMRTITLSGAFLFALFAIMYLYSAFTA